MNGPILPYTVRVSTFRAYQPAAGWNGCWRGRLRAVVLAPRGAHDGVRGTDIREELLGRNWWARSVALIDDLRGQAGLMRRCPAQIASTKVWVRWGYRGRSRDHLPVDTRAGPAVPTSTTQRNRRGSARNTGQLIHASITGRFATQHHTAGVRRPVASDRPLALATAWYNSTIPPICPRW